MEQAWVTMATNDTYAVGALVLAGSLKRVQTTRKLHIIVTDALSSQIRNALGQVFDGISCVNVMDSGDAENLALIGRPDLGVTFTKLHCWRLTQYSKCVFLDADTMVVKNCDELFDREELSAAPDFGWPDCFNSGVFVLRPSLETYRALASMSTTSGSFDGGDQGILNEFFGNWKSGDSSRRLSILYNLSSSSVYTYSAAYKRYGLEAKIVHFLGDVKPWHYASGSHPTGQHLIEHVVYWWTVYNQDVKPYIPEQEESDSNQKFGVQYPLDADQSYPLPVASGSGVSSTADVASASSGLSYLQIEEKIGQSLQK